MEHRSETGSPSSSDMEDNSERGLELFAVSEDFSGQGCHEDWDTVYPEQNNSQDVAPNQETEEDLRQQIGALQGQIEHLEVHSYIYQQALLKVENGVHVWHKVKEEEYGSSDPICHQCQIDKLMGTIAKLQQQVNHLKASK